MQSWALQPKPRPVTAPLPGCSFATPAQRSSTRSLLATLATVSDQDLCCKLVEPARRESQAVHFLSLSHIYGNSLWTAFPQLQKRWLEHIWQLTHPSDHLVVVDTSSGTPSSPVNATTQLEPPSARPLGIFGGCSGGGDKDPDFYANVGSAIRTLREEIPALFQVDLSYEIYRPDIVFRDPRNHFEGLRNYKVIFWSLRFHGQLFFSRIYVRITRLWQPDEMTLRMRWTVIGTPRVPWEAKGTFDGISNFRLDKRGKIYEHQVDNVILRDPPLQSPFLAGLNLLAGGGDRTPVPTAFNFDSSTQMAATEEWSDDTLPVPVRVADCETQDARWVDASRHH